VRALAHRIIVLKDGKVGEEGDAERIVADARQPYTRALMAAAFDLRTAEQAVVRS
jgi:microcin C transport system ATP-binding protein